MTGVNSPVARSLKRAERMPDQYYLFPTAAKPRRGMLSASQYSLAINAGLNFIHCMRFNA
jgi:hypothetical protein